MRFESQRFVFIIATIFSALVSVLFHTPITWKPCSFMQFPYVNCSKNTCSKRLHTCCRVGFWSFWWCSYLLNFICYDIIFQFNFFFIELALLLCIWLFDYDGNVSYQSFSACLFLKPRNCVRALYLHKLSSSVYELFFWQIRVIDRNCEIPHEGPFCDLMWSDPEDIETWAVSPRGAGWLFGSRVTSEVMISCQL